MFLFHDKELKDIAVTVNPRSRRFVFRCKDGLLTCTSPMPYREKDLQQAIEELRPKLRALLQKGQEKAKAKRFTPDTRIDAESFRVKFVQKDIPVAKAEKNGTDIICYYHSPEVLAEERVQAWFTRTLEVFARRHAKEQLVPRLLSMAADRGLDVRSVKISSAKGRWGSCSAKGNINLSLFLAILPRHLQDYVMQHELTHLIEMNHSPRFWARLDEVCDGRAKALRMELRRYNTSFLI